MKITRNRQLKNTFDRSRNNHKQNIKFILKNEKKKTGIITFAQDIGFQFD